MKAKIKDYIRTFNRKSILTLESEDDISVLVDDLKDKEITVTLKRYRKPRSLDANNLCWAMCTEIANVLRSDKDSVYVEMLKRYGQSDVISVQSNVDISNYVKYYDEFGTGYVNGKEFTHYKVFKGSSDYDVHEMSVLLDGIISEARELGIPTESDRELSLIKDAWRNE